MRHAFRFSLAALGAALLSASVEAQVPGVAPIKASPIPGLAGGLKSPDLVVTMAPGNPFPASFTVRNAGNADAGVSVLRVTATLLPLDRVPGEPCPPIFASICEARAQAAAAWYTAERLQTMCGDPFADVLEAIPALKAGESKAVARDTSRFANLAVRLKGALGPQPGTHIVQGVTTLVCAFDVVALADASNQVHEIREDNNTSSRRVFREIRLE